MRRGSADYTRMLKREFVRELERLVSAGRGPAAVERAPFFVVRSGIREIQWLLNEMKGRTVMAKAPNFNNDWKGFVDVKLTGSEKENYAAWDVHDGDLWVLLVDAIVAGHKLSVTYNKQNDQFVASLTGAATAGNSAGYTLSAFAHVWYEALRVLMFKHVVILGQDWTAAKERVGEDIG